MQEMNKIGICFAVLWSAVVLIQGQEYASNGRPTPLCTENSSGTSDQCIQVLYAQPRTVCPPGSFMTEGQLCGKYIEKIQLCPSGYTLSGNICSKRRPVQPALACPPDFTLISDENSRCSRQRKLPEVVDCPAGAFLDANGRCIRESSISAIITCPSSLRLVGSEECRQEEFYDCLETHHRVPSDSSYSSHPNKDSRYQQQKIILPQPNNTADTLLTLSGEHNFFFSQDVELSLMEAQNSSVQKLRNPKVTNHLATAPDDEDLLMKMNWLDNLFRILRHKEGNDNEEALSSAKRLMLSNVDNHPTDTSSQTAWGLPMSSDAVENRQSNSLNSTELQNSLELPYVLQGKPNSFLSLKQRKQIAKKERNLKNNDLSKTTLKKSKMSVEGYIKHNNSQSQRKDVLQFLPTQSTSFRSTENNPISPTPTEFLYEDAQDCPEPMQFPLNPHRLLNLRDIYLAQNSFNDSFSSLEEKSSLSLLPSMNASKALDHNATQTNRTYDLDTLFGKKATLPSYLQAMETATLQTLLAMISAAPTNHTGNMIHHFHKNRSSALIPVEDDKRLFDTNQNLRCYSSENYLTNRAHPIPCPLHITTNEAIMATYDEVVTKTCKRTRTTKATVLCPTGSNLMANHRCVKKEEVPVIHKDGGYMEETLTAKLSCPKGSVPKKETPSSFFSLSLTSETKLLCIAEDFKEPRTECPPGTEIKDSKCFIYIRPMVQCPPKYILENQQCVLKVRVTIINDDHTAPLFL